MNAAQGRHVAPIVGFDIIIKADETEEDKKC
jgi:hypothetical protein